MDKSYCKILKDRNGFVRDPKYKPKIYDLVKLKLSNDKMIYGWWTGREWFGRLLKKEHEVIGWKKKQY